MEISPITHLGEHSKFGKSAVTNKLMSEGKEHKEARQCYSKLANLFCHLGIPFLIGSDYLQHNQNHNVYLQITIGEHRYFLGVQETGNIIGKSAIVGGTCIGGSETIIGFDEKGNEHSLLESDIPDTLNVPVTKILMNPKPTLYEIDSISRISTFVKNLTLNNPNKISMFWHIPLPEYLLYLKQYYDSKVITKKQGLEIGQFLFKKVLFLSKWLTKNISGKIDVKCGSPLTKFISLENLFEENLESVLYKLSLEDQLWKILIADNEVTTWIGLADLSYAYMYLKESTKYEWILGVENPEESKIFSQAKKLANKSNIPFNMTCLYIHPSYLEASAFPARLYRHKKTIPDEVKHIYHSYQ